MEDCSLTSDHFTTQNEKHYKWESYLVQFIYIYIYIGGRGASWVAEDLRMRYFCTHLPMNSRETSDRNSLLPMTWNMYFVWPRLSFLMWGLFSWRRKIFFYEIENIFLESWVFEKIELWVAVYCLLSVKIWKMPCFTNKLHKPSFPPKHY
jgi:hypothetical protein